MPDAADRHPRLQRAARAAAAAAGAGRQLALLARARLRPGHLARAALPRLSARARSRAPSTPTTTTPRPPTASSRPATCPTTPSCGGTSARTRAWARSRCARWTASRRCGRRPAWPRSSTALARAEAHEAARRLGCRARCSWRPPSRPRATGCARGCRWTARCAPRRRWPAPRWSARGRTPRELGSGDALEGIERILAEGNGADRQRAAHARGGMPALLDLLVAEAEAPYG